jgi:ribosome-binding protein aMBF1 (putative translation factor)
MDITELKANLVYARVKNGLGSGELAEKLKMHPNTYRKKENNPLKFNLDELFELEQILGTKTIDEIFKKGA